MIIREEEIDNLSSINLPTKTLVRKFGKREDNVELYVYDLNNTLLVQEENFKGYKPPDIISDKDGLYNEINIDYTETLRKLGFTSGQYKLELGFYRKLILDTFAKPFYISKISPSGKEIKIKSDLLSDDDVINGINQISGIVNSSVYFREILLNFSRNRKSTAINFNIDAVSDPTEVLIKLYNPLPPNVKVGERFRMSEEIINPVSITVDLGKPTLDDLIEGEEIKGPNLRIDTRLNSSKPSAYRNYDQLLGSSVSSSFHNINNYLSSSLELAIDFSDTDTETKYHFENFIHFSSATERLKNFNYKLTLLKGYDNDINDIDTLTGPQTSSVSVISERNNIEKKKKNLIGGFDSYERFLYFDSGTYSWPKSNSAKPYTLYSVDSNQAKEWLGSEVDTNNYYGGQLLSSSRYDDINIHNLKNTLPNFILSNPDNTQYVLFVNMVGEHFDKIWIYIDHITQQNQADSKLNRGISKDLVYDVLEKAGLKVFDQFENENLFSYLTGDEGANGIFQYQAPVSQSMISASNAGSIPKGDITKEIWKRLHDNLPYLLKTKGTERGMKALISCYGIPESILHVKEYGGPTVDKTGFRTFSYKKKSKMGAPNGASAVLQSQLIPNTTKTIQTRFLPTQGSTTAFDIMSIAPSASSNDVVIGISQSLNNSTINSASFAHLVIASGSLADSSAGRIKVITGSLLGPIFNGDVWNLSVRLNSSSAEGNTIEAFATNTTFNKNTYVLSCSMAASGFFASMDSAKTRVTIGSALSIGSHAISGSLINPFSGSVQEYRVWDEKLNKNTIVTQSLSPFNYNGNSISSSFGNLIQRVPIGSDYNNIASGDINNAPNKIFRNLYSASIGLGATPITTFIEETHHLTTPDTVGKSMVSDKVRLDTGTVEDNILSPFIKSEESVQDRQPNDFSDLGVFFSPTFEVNEDIIYTLGGFRMDDYIGDPRHHTASSYPDLDTLKDIYVQKIDKKIVNIFDYLKLIQQFDHTLFKMIEQFAPAKANLKTGLVIEPHYLERSKINGLHLTIDSTSYNTLIPGTNPPITSEYLLNESIIDIHDIILSGSGGELENNAIYGIRSDKFFRRVRPYNQYAEDVVTNPITNVITGYDPTEGK